MQMTTSMTTQMQAVRERIQAKWDVKVLATAVLLFLVFITGFAIVQYATPALVGNDGYYHMKMGYLIRTESNQIFPTCPTPSSTKQPTTTTTCCTMCSWGCLPPPTRRWTAAWR